MNYEEIKSALNGAIKSIDWLMSTMGANRVSLEKYYKANYLEHKDNVYTDVNGNEFMISIDGFSKLFSENITFLRTQLEFIKKLSKLDYIEGENKLSKYTSRILSSCIRNIKDIYDFKTNKEELLFDLLYTMNVEREYRGILYLEKFYKYDEDIILIGGNGSGKTTLANYIKGEDTDEIAVVAAQKNLYFSINDPNILMTDKKELVQMLFENNIKKGKVSDLAYSYYDFQNNQFTRLIIGMQSEYILYLYKCDAGEERLNSNTTVFGRLKRIFHIIFPDIDLIFEDPKAFCFTCIKNGKRYQVNGLSEGEKVAIYYIISVLMAKENSTVIVDEPETYLNPSLANSLWDILTSERDDCQFIFITHSVDFVLGRSNCKLAWIKNYTFPNEWEFEVLEDDKNLPKPMLTEILGSKKPIVFCEGNDKSSLDYHIYKAILEKDYTVIPVHGHRQVINCCRAVNDFGLNYSAYGIIDGDNISEEKIEKYKRDNIVVLPFNEIEMFILEEEIVEKTIRDIYPAKYRERIDKFKMKLWETVELRKEKIILSYVKQIVDEYVESKKISSEKSIEDICNDLKNISNFDVKKIYTDKLDQIDDIIKSQDYQKLLQVCNLKKEITKGIADRELDSNYEEKVKQHIMTDEELQTYLRKVYFDFNEKLV